MKIKHRLTGEIGQSGRFNTHGISEIIVFFEDWTDTDFIKNYDVYIEKTGEWITFKQAFAEKHIIVDNYNTIFFEPENEKDRKRGYSA